MGNQLTPQEKQKLVARYQKGESVSAICMQSGTSKSTFYNWVKQYSTVTSRMGNEVHHGNLTYEEEARESN